MANRRLARRRAAWGFSWLCGIHLVLAGAPRALADELPPVFIRGDANVDRKTTIADVFLILRYLSLGSSVACKSAADVDDNGRIEQLDALLLLGSLFQRDAPLPPPFVKAGTDPTPADGLGCRQGLRRGLGGNIEADPVDGETVKVCDNDQWGADLELIHFRGPILAYPGENRIRVPVLMRSPGELEGFTISLRSESPHLELQRLDLAGTMIDAERPDWSFTYTKERETGYLSASVALSMSAPFRTLPALHNDPVAYLEIGIRPDAAVGQLLEVSFADTPGGENMRPISNEVSRRGFSQRLGACGLKVRVVSGEDLFVRGDANRDRLVNITDAIVTLQALFIGARTNLPCLDAADVDDNGSVDITDAIGLAGYMFGQAPAPRSPYPEAGHDITADTIGCVTGS
jgi:hypothetical protein